MFHLLFQLINSVNLFTIQRIKTPTFTNAINFRITIVFPLKTSSLTKTAFGSINFGPLSSTTRMIDFFQAGAKKRH